MERGRVTVTELMPRLVVGYAELGGGKLKKAKGFLKPNFGVGPKPNWQRVRYDEYGGFRNSARKAGR